MIMKDDLLFWTDLACLVGSSVPIDKSLDILAESVESETWQQFARLALEKIQAGGTFGEACADNPDLISPFITTIVEYSEKNGNLSGGTERIVIHLEAHMDAEVEDMFDEWADQFDDEDDFDDEIYDDEDETTN